MFFVIIQLLCHVNTLVKGAVHRYCLRIHISNLTACFITQVYEIMDACAKSQWRKERLLLLQPPQFIGQVLVDLRGFHDPGALL